MHRNGDIGKKRTGTCHNAICWSGAAALFVLTTLVQPCRAQATLQGAPGASGAATASARLDFRITVLPSLSLSTQATGVRAQGNSGVLTLQHSRTDADDGRAPIGSSQLAPRRQVVDAAERSSRADGVNLITVASP